jgi:hypothetical protein
MATVTKASSSAVSVTKKAVAKKKVESQRPISTLEELGDVNVGTPGSGQDGYLLAYDSATDTFNLISPDTYLSSAVEDSDLPDNFITQLENELDLGSIQVDSVDGGGF